MRIPRRARRRGSGSAAGALERRLVWILGSPRSGSTWLLNLIGQAPGTILIDEPSIGAHLGVLATGLFPTRPDRVEADRLRLNDWRSGAGDYFFSARYEPTWRPLVRELVLGRLGAQVHELARRRGIADPLVAIKEPNGSQGADVLMSALPAARMIFLLRDGRDVVDSELDGAREGGWAAREMEGFRTADEDRTMLARERAYVWLCRTAAVQRAYEAHPAGLRRLVRYEDLLADTVGEFSALADWLGLGLDRGAVEAAVAELSFERMDEGVRGPGRFARAARPGLWRESLSAAEQEAVHAVIGAKLEELGYPAAG